MPPKLHRKCKEFLKELDEDGSIREMNYAIFNDKCFWNQKWSIHKVWWQSWWRLQFQNSLKTNESKKENATHLVSKNSTRNSKWRKLFSRQLATRWGFFWKHEDIFRGTRGKFNRSKRTYFKKPSIAQKVHKKLLSMLIGYLGLLKELFLFHL